MRCRTRTRARARSSRTQFKRSKLDWRQAVRFTTFTVNFTCRKLDAVKLTAGILPTAAAAQKMGVVPVSLVDVLLW
jgi:hypothetical protein